MRVGWGFLGCGRIASDFVNALKSVNGAELTACAARSEASAQHFGTTHGVGAAYGSYEALAADPSVDVVYVSTLHHLHKQHALMCLQARKHVLVEKPIALTLQDANELVEEAARAGVFLMEGVWTRFFPAVRKAKALLRADAIGSVKAVYSDFGSCLTPYQGLICSTRPRVVVV